MSGFLPRLVVGLLLLIALPSGQGIQGFAAQSGFQRLVPGQDVGMGLAKLLKAYPGQLAAAETNALVWKDGARMVYDDGRRIDDPEERLSKPSLYYQMLEGYPAGSAGIPPVAGVDPCRVRYEPFFRKMYGATREEVRSHLVPVQWLAGTVRKTLMVTSINSVDRRLEAVSRELEKLPAHLRRFVEHSSGTFNWRMIEGTGRLSPHAFGIAIDIDAVASDYWRWGRSKGTSVPPYRNRVPLEIVAIFERHGFIWGGKWTHFDTMHFEYRPECL